jgi:hypothetical protein
MSVQGETFQTFRAHLSTDLAMLEMTVPFDHTNDHTSVLTSMCRLQNLTSIRVSRSRFEVPPASDVVCADIPPHHYTYSVRVPDVIPHIM